MTAQLRDVDIAFEKETAQKASLLTNIDEMESTKLEKQAEFEQLLDQYAKIEQVPGRLARQIESIEKAVASMEADHQRLQRRIRALDQELEKQARRKIEAEKLRKGLMEKLELNRQTIEQREQDVAIVRINLENEKVKSQQLIACKLELTLKKRESESTARHKSDQLSFARKEYDALKRQLKKKRGIADGARQVIPNLEIQLQDQEVVHRSYVEENERQQKALDALKEELDVHVLQCLQQENVEHDRGEVINTHMIMMISMMLTMFEFIDHDVCN